MKILSTFLLLLLPFSLFAEETKWFIGLDAGATGLVLTEDENATRAYGPQYGLKVGYIEENGRVYLGYTVSSSLGEGVEKTQTPYIALEGISNEFKVIGSATAKFFFGFRLGASIADVQNATTLENSTVTAFMGGAQTGLSFMLPADFEIELAYRHDFTFKDDETNYNAGNVYTGLIYNF